MHCDGVSVVIYLDNAATTFPKPPQVMHAVNEAMVRYGANPGRSGHRMSLQTAEMIYNCREKAAEFFGLPDAQGVVFTANCTMSLNMVIRGVVGNSGRVLISDLEHNAVWRTVNALPYGKRYDMAAWSPDDDETVENFRRAITRDTRLIVCTHASNVFGVVMPIRRLARLAHEYGILFCVDAAQSGGILPIDMEKDDIDFLCVAPHKGLYAPMGTGILLCRTRHLLTPLICGGTGSGSLSFEQPTELPERLESGTVNVMGICGISAGLDFLKARGRERVYAHETALVQWAHDKLSLCEGIRLYTQKPAMGCSVPVLSVNIDGETSETVAEWLSQSGVAVRAGLHCAPLAHQRFDTLPHGTVRIAPSAFTTMGEMETVCKLFSHFSQKKLHTQKNMI